MKISHLTPSEELLMNVMWRLNSAYMREIIDEYPDPKPHPNTISTFLKILVEKEFLTIKKEGRIFNYFVAVPYEEYRRYLVNIFLEQYFDSDPSKFVALLVEQKLIGEDIVSNKINSENEAHITDGEKVDEDSDLSAYIEKLTSTKKKKKKKKNSKKKKKE